MVFSSVTFVFFFLPAVLAAYLVAPRRLRNTVLLAASLFFYAWGEAFWVAIMLVSIAVNHAAGLAIERAGSQHAKRRALVLAITVDLGILVAFKYAGFLAANVSAALELVGAPALPPVDVHLPIGISFFTFQAISYVVDTYRGETHAQTRIADTALYISLFPQLIAGPIIRYASFATQIANRHTSLDDVVRGVQRFVIGFAKKVLIANQVAVGANAAFALGDGELTAAAAWVGIVCYALQIYFDFSGYSDMAIGLARVFGFRFAENFDHPYVSRSIREFWRRWHVSLSTWFRDYLYIPLGGSRAGRLREYRNLLLVFFLCGLWHGASWNFVVWGMLHGVFLVAERALPAWRVPSVVRRAYVLLVVLVAWVFFRAETFGQASSYLTAMFGLGADAELTRPLMPRDGFAALAVGVVAATPLGRDFAVRVSARAEMLGGKLVAVVDLSRVAALMLVLLVSLSYLAAGAFNPFIYFRF